MDFSVPIRNLRIQNFNNYSTFDLGFQERLHLNVWSEFRQNVEQAVSSYTSDPNLTSWKGTYKCLSTIPFILAIISGISMIYSFYALTFGLIFIKEVWVSAVVLISLFCVWGVIVWIVRMKLLDLKAAYHTEINNRVQQTLQQLNNKYSSQCQFLLERISGMKAVDVDFSCNLRMFFKIILFTQQVQQYGAMGNMPISIAAGQQQAVMVQMPNGQMVMAQVVGQPVNAVMSQQQYVPPLQQQQIYAGPVLQETEGAGAGANQDGGEGANDNANVGHTLI